ncbi:MAG TPA: hypothetical protein VND87_17100 [Stellaceae bacterium]|nr:hypothetical protein [Stellaceae bacterium]
MAHVVPIDPPKSRQRTIRARNRALLVVLVALVALFYALAVVRMSGG